MRYNISAAKSVPHIALKLWSQGPKNQEVGAEAEEMAEAENEKPSSFYRFVRFSTHYRVQVFMVLQGHATTPHTSRKHTRARHDH